MEVMAIAKGDVRLSLAKFPDRKQHSLVVYKGNCVYVIGTCRNPKMWNETINELFK